MSLGGWFRGLSTTGKVVTVGAAYAGGVLAYKALSGSSDSGYGSASLDGGAAGSPPSTGQLYPSRPFFPPTRFFPVPGALVGDWYARMRTRYRVRMFGPWRLYERLGGSPFVASTVYPGGEVVEIIAPAPGLRVPSRPRERLYLVQVIRPDGSRGARGYANVSPELVWA